MKRAIVSIGLIVSAIASPTIAQEPVEATISGLPYGIESALKDYVEGARKGDHEQLSRSFNTSSGVMYSVRRNDDGDELRATPFDEFVAFFEDPNPLPTSGRILSFDIVENHMAFVKFEYIEDKDRYIDYLTLMQIDGDWQIVAKAYHYQPGKK